MFHLVHSGEERSINQWNFFLIIIFSKFSQPCCWCYFEKRWVSKSDNQMMTRDIGQCWPICLNAMHSMVMLLCHEDWIWEHLIFFILCFLLKMKVYLKGRNIRAERAPPPPCFLRKMCVCVTSLSSLLQLNLFFFASLFVQALLYFNFFLNQRTLWTVPPVFTSRTFYKLTQAEVWRLEPSLSSADHAKMFLLNQDWWRIWRHCGEKGRWLFQKMWHGIGQDFFKAEASIW